MRTQSLLLLLFVAPGLVAGSEYDKFHVGPIVGIGWSPAKDYAVLDTTLNGKRQVAAVAGLAFRFGFVPGKLELGLDAEGVQALNIAKSAKSDDVSQTVWRGTLRLLVHNRGLSNDGMYWWIGGDYNGGTTKATVPIGLTTHSTSITQNLVGWNLGLGTRTLNERNLTFYEVRIGFVPTGSLGTKVGGATVEFKTGLLW